MSSPPLPSLFDEASLTFVLPGLLTSDAFSPPPPDSLSQPNPTMAAKPAKQKKKRVRRETRELKYLRDQTRQLELRLEQLKKRVPMDRNSPSPARDTDEVTSPSVWESIAERQLKARLHGEQQRSDLVAACSVQSKYVLELKKQLKLCMTDRKLARLTKHKAPRPWDLSSEDSSGVYAELLTLVAKQYMKMQHSSHLSSALQLSTDITQGAEVVKRDPRSDTECTFETGCRTIVPFDVRVAGNAYWRLFTFEVYERQGSLQMDLDGDVASSSFDLQVDCDGFKAAVRGKQTCKRYISDDCEVIVWAGYADPYEFNGTQFTGMQCRKTGWIKIQRAAGESSTVVEIYSEMIPVFKDGVENQSWQVQALIDSMADAHSKTNSIYCRMVYEVLLEEDWKATYEGNTLALSC